jgi:hypothetical protein
MDRVISSGTLRFCWWFSVPSVDITIPVFTTKNGNYPVYLKTTPRFIFHVINNEVITMKRFTPVVCMAFLLLIMAGIPAAASPAISSISPATAPNNGDVTVTITGTGFNAQSTAWLKKSLSNDAPIYGTVVSWTPTTMTCTFSIQGLTPAKYHVWVNSPFTDPNGNPVPEDVTFLDSGFAIYEGTSTTATTTTAPAPTMGSIRVSSIPPGADIYLDNEYKGVTPLTIIPVENGNHLLVARRTGYQDWTQNVRVLGNSLSLSASLAAIPAPATVLTVITTPVAPVRTTASPVGIEAGIIAIIGAALLLIKRK